MVALSVSLLAGLVLTYMILLAALVAARPKGKLLGEAMRLLPDVVGMLRRLTADPGVPRGVRIRLWLLLAYLATPIDLVPDFLPVIGHADDAIVVSLVLRSVVRRAGAPAIRRHWRGTDGGLVALGRITGQRLGG